MVIRWTIRAAQAVELTAFDRGIGRLFWTAALWIACAQNGWAGCVIPEGSSRGIGLNVSTNAVSYPEHAMGFAAAGEWGTLEGIGIFDCTGPSSVRIEVGDRSVETYTEGGEEYAVIPFPATPDMGMVLRVSEPNGFDTRVLGPGTLPMYSPVDSIKFRIQYRVVAKPQAVGKFNLSNGKLIKFVGDNSRDTYTLRTEGRSDLHAATCVSEFGHSTVEVDTVSTDRFSGVGSQVEGARFELKLDCDPFLRLFATMTDATDPANRGDVLTLSTSSTGGGIGYRLLYEDLPVSYGPDSAMAGTKNQFNVADSGPVSSGRFPITMPFKVHYIQTEEVITSGTVDAVATITLSYQ